MTKVNNVLWTGGWDSTFRVIQLYRLGATIQSIYVLDHNRKSSVKELEVVNRLTNEIPLRFKESEGNILPLIVIKRKDIPSNPFLKLIHKRLKNKANYGKQYYWLACLAKGNQYQNLEVSFHKEDLAKFFSKEQLIEIKDEKTGSTWRLNPKKIDFFRMQLFKKMTFPLITFSKPEMKVIAEDNNFIDLMESTWFCQKLYDKPCGKCNPCKQYVRDGFGYRLQ